MTLVPHRDLQILAGVLLLSAGVATIGFANKKMKEVSPIPSTSTQALEAHVRMLSEKLAPRDCGHVANLDRTAAYIRKHLQEAGGHVSDQTFETHEFNQRNQRITQGPFRNVIASFGPDSAERIVIGAHYDAAGSYPGADDNASGIAALLELAKLLGQKAPALRTDLVAYTLEEPPYFGSQEMGSAIHAASLAQAGVRVRFMISLEILGYYSDQPKSQTYPNVLLKMIYPSRGNFLAIVSRFGLYGLCRRLKKRMSSVTPLPFQILTAPAILPGVDFSDHRNYWPHGYPAVMLTDTASYRNPHYHKSTDTAEKLDYPRMAQAVTAVYAVVAAEK